MSEHQVHEFVALDRPLTAKQMAELRAISTRAEISPTRFWNEYHWGDLKADPAKLVERYFDAYLYSASWGRRRLMLRLPAASVDVKQLDPYFLGDAASVRKVGEHVLLDFTSESEEPEYEADDTSLAALALVRGELSGGDLRAAYLAWLLAVQADEIDAEDLEPPVPPGLLALSAPLEAMVDFLRIDRDLLAAAAEGSVAEPDDAEELRRWVAALPARTRDQWLRRAVDEPTLALGAELRRAFRAQGKAKATAGLRMVEELRSLAEEQHEKRKRADAARAGKAQRAEAAARKKRLDALAKRLDAAWGELEGLVGNSRYDDAFPLAIDLHDLAAREGTSASFAATFEAMRKRQLRRRAFFDRWKRENVSKRG